jgi:hypothetical protein
VAKPIIAVAIVMLEVARIRFSSSLTYYPLSEQRIFVLKYL